MRPEAHQIPFHFKPRPRVLPDTIPFHFGRHEAADSTPIAPNPRPKTKPQIGHDWTGQSTAQKDVSGCLNIQAHAQKVDDNLLIHWVDIEPVSGCLTVKLDRLADVWRVWTRVSGAAAHLHGCWQSGIPFAPKLISCATTVYAESVLWVGDSSTFWQGQHFVNETAVLLPMSEHLKNCFTDKSSGSHLSGCLKTKTGRSVQPPCEWYPIPIDPPPPPKKDRCPTPPSDRIPFHFRKKRTRYDAAQIPFHFACGQSQAQIPALDTYMICHEISANLADGTPLEVLSVNIRADTSGYCWQGDLTVSPDSFAKIQFRQPEKDVITVLINGERFDLMAEDFSDNRQFPSKNYTITGRSQTALLGVDYATSQAGLVSADLYARQIADSQLKFTNFSIENWVIVDWLVPQNVYSLTDKTPIAVIQDISQAAGGFVCSHPYLPQLDVRPLWRVPAWALGTAAPDVQVPSSAIVSISGSLNVQARCHAVGVSASHSAGKAANVYRREREQVPRAGDLSHALYTEYSVCKAAGVAALSATGLHKTENVKLPIMPKYGLRRAELGEIWRFDEPSISWCGVVTSVQISVEMNGDVPVIYQTLGVDRYMDD